MAFSKMDIAKVLIVYWHDKRHSVQILHQKLQARPVPICPAYSSITNWVSARDQGQSILMRAS
jgi:hypothetical protein